MRCGYLELVLRLAALIEQKLTGLHSSSVASCGSPLYPLFLGNPETMRLNPTCIIWWSPFEIRMLMGVGEDIHDGKNSPLNILNPLPVPLRVMN